MLVAEIGNTPYALIYDRTDTDERLGRLALFLLVATILLTLLSYHWWGKSPGAPTRQSDRSVAR